MANEFVEGHRVALQSLLLIQVPRHILPQAGAAVYMVCDTC